MTSAREIALALGGDVVSFNRVAAPGPGHSSKDRSLSVLITGSDFIVHSFAGDDGVSARITCALASASRLSTTDADHDAHAGAGFLQFGADRSEGAA